jgi:acyl carrier protein
VITSTRDFKGLKKLLGAAPGSGEVKPRPDAAVTGTSLKRPEISTVYQAPRNEIEKKLAETMENYFGIDRIGVHDNFFELGATSLDFAQVIGPLAKALDKDIPLVAMFSYPTIADLGEYLEQEEKKLTFSQEEKERLKKKDTSKRKKLEERRIRHKRGGKNE